MVGHRPSNEGQLLVDFLVHKGKASGLSDVSWPGSLERHSAKLRFKMWNASRVPRDSNQFESGNHDGVGSEYA